MKDADWSSRYAVQAAYVSDRGLMTAGDLARLDTDRWEYLRNSISNYQRGASDEIRAECASCGHEVFVNAPLRAGHPPFFKHRIGAPISCPWHGMEARHPDHIRAEKFNGLQESPIHRRMCELLLELASRDPNYVPNSGAVDQYLPASTDERGRYPDVFFEWRDHGRFALEFQLASTMQYEIAGRELFYGTQGVTLIWVLGRFSPDQPMSASFRDIIHRHRGNAFVLDEAAIRMSRERATLCLTAYLQSEDGRFDIQTTPIARLTTPARGLAFLEDRTIGPVQSKVEDRRLRQAEQLRALKDALRPAPICGLSQLDPWEARRFAAVAYSCWSAALGEWENFLNRQQNLRGLLNGYLNSEDGRCRAALLRPLIEGTQAAEEADGKLLARLSRCMSEVPQVGFDEAEADFLFDHFPEVCDPEIRERWRKADALPQWACPPGGAMPARLVAPRQP